MKPFVRSLLLAGSLLCPVIGSAGVAGAVDEVALQRAIGVEKTVFDFAGGRTLAKLPFLESVVMGENDAVFLTANEESAREGRGVAVEFFNAYGMRLSQVKLSFGRESGEPSETRIRKVLLGIAKLDEIFAASTIELPPDWRAPRFVAIQALPEIESRALVAKAVRPAVPRPALTKTIQARPVIVAQNNFGTANIGPTAVDPKWNQFGEYLRRMIDTVQIQWERMLVDWKANPATGSRVAVKFILDSDGKIAQIVKADSTANDIGTRACVSAIAKPAPYGPWTAEMKAVLGDRQEMTFTFYYQ
ncbi:MAG: hypothetical protein V4773_23240 [Verrucomicrobiota bacterium]